MTPLIERLWRLARKRAEPQLIVLKLKPEPDGFGFLYGTVSDRHGTVHRVDIMPPVAEWRGDIKMAEHGPHATDWVVYADGMEIARVRRREELPSGIGGWLLTKE